MILNDEEIQETMESPINLMNRLRKVSDPSSLQNISPLLPPTADQLINDLEDKLDKGKTLKSKAAAIMDAALDELKKRMPEVTKPEKLAAIATEMSKVVIATQEKKEENSKAQIIIYAPQFKTEDAFDVITVSD